MKKKKFMIMYPVALVIMSVAAVLTFVLTALKSWFDSWFWHIRKKRVAKIESIW